MKRVFFAGGYSPNTSQSLTEALEALQGIEERALTRLSKEIIEICSDFETASEFAREAQLSEDELSRIITLSLRLHVGSAISGQPMVAALDELEAAGGTDEQVDALRRYIPYLAQADDELGAHLGRREATDVGVPRVADVQITWSLRAGYADAVYWDGNETDAVDVLRQFIPVGMLKVACIGSDVEDFVAQIDAEDIGRLIDVLDHAKRRLDELMPYAEIQEEGEIDGT